MRRAASCCQPTQVRSGPRGARRVRGPVVGGALVAADMGPPAEGPGRGAVGIIAPMSRPSRSSPALELTGDNLTLEAAAGVLSGQVERLSLAPAALARVERA